MALQQTVDHSPHQSTRPSYIFIELQEHRTIVLGVL